MQSLTSGVCPGLRVGLWLKTFRFVAPGLLSGAIFGNCTFLGGLHFESRSQMNL